MLLLVKVSASVSGSIILLTIVDRGLCVPSLIMFGSPSHMQKNCSHLENPFVRFEQKFVPRKCSNPNDIHAQPFRLIHFYPRIVFLWSYILYNWIYGSRKHTLRRSFYSCGHLCYVKTHPYFMLVNIGESIWLNVYQAESGPVWIILFYIKSCI